MLFRILIVQGAILLSENVSALTQIIQFKNSINEIDTSSSKTNQNKISYQKSSASFYKTDSIFSFQSPKGYVPSLLSNFEEQIIAPLRFNKKDWIITGAAVGVTIASFILITILTNGQPFRNGSMSG